MCVGIYYAVVDRKKNVDNYYYGGRKMSPVKCFAKFYVIVCYKANGVSLENESNMEYHYQKHVAKS